MALDLDLGVMNGFVYRSMAGVQDLSLLLAARHGGENKKELVVFECQFLES
jgi:hypothetical protein